MSRYPRTIAAGISIAFFVLALCGAGLLVAHTDAGMTMTGCPFGGTMDPSCPLFSADHLRTFTSVLVSLPVQSGLLTLALIAFAALLVSTSSPELFAVPLRVRNDRRTPDATLWRPLKFAFMRGIVHPKVY